MSRNVLADRGFGAIGEMADDAVSAVTVGLHPWRRWCVLKADGPIIEEAFMIRAVWNGTVVAEAPRTERIEDTWLGTFV
jgi:hypothetical protein